MQRIAPFCYYYQELSGLHALELAVVEIRIEALLRKQLLMRTALDDIAIFQYKDQISILDCRKPVCDYKRSSSLHQFVHGSLDDKLGSRIDRACRLI